MALPVVAAYVALGQIMVLVTLYSNPLPIHSLRGSNTVDAEAKGTEQWVLLNSSPASRTAHPMLELRQLAGFAHADRVLCRLARVREGRETAQFRYTETDHHCWEHCLHAGPTARYARRLY